MNDRIWIALEYLAFTLTAALVVTAFVRPTFSSVAGSVIVVAVLANGLRSHRLTKDRPQP